MIVIKVTRKRYQSSWPWTCLPSPQGSMEVDSDRRRLWFGRRDPRKSGGPVTSGIQTSYDLICFRDHVNYIGNTRDVIDPQSTAMIKIKTILFFSTFSKTHWHWNLNWCQQTLLCPWPNTCPFEKQFWEQHKFQCWIFPPSFIHIWIYWIKTLCPNCIPFSIYSKKILGISIWALYTEFPPKHTSQFRLHMKALLTVKIFET